MFCTPQRNSGEWCFLYVSTFPFLPTVSGRKPTSVQLQFTHHHFHYTLPPFCSPMHPCNRSVLVCVSVFLPHETQIKSFWRAVSHVHSKSRLTIDHALLAQSHCTPHYHYNHSSHARTHSISFACVPWGNYIPHPAPQSRGFRRVLH